MNDSNANITFVIVAAFVWQVDVYLIHEGAMREET